MTGIPSENIANIWYLTSSLMFSFAQSAMVDDGSMYKLI